VQEIYDGGVVYRKEVQELFDRYIKNHVRRLKRVDAVEMFKTEFNFTEEQANCMFSTFDRDKNDVMSLWEFQHFCRKKPKHSKAQSTMPTSRDVRDKPWRPL